MSPLPPCTLKNRSAHHHTHSDYISTLQLRSPSTVQARTIFSIWLSEFAAWSLAATITFRRYRDGQPINPSIAEAALRHTFRVLDTYCFGKNRVVKGHHVASAAVIGWGPFGTHPHAHLALSTPLIMSDESLQERFEQAADKTIWLARERVVTPYRDSGWIDYLIDHSLDSLVVSLLRPGSDPGANFP